MFDFSERLKKAGIKHFANDNVAELVKEDDQAQMIKALTEKMGEVLDVLGIDYLNDHNTQETPKRIAKSWVNDLFHGRYTSAPPIKEFDNDRNYDGMIMIGPIAVKSMCAHHFLEIAGHCYVGVHPGKKVIGLSKYNRIVSWFSRRPQIQEDLTKQIADFLYEKMDAKGVAVYIRAEHHCMKHRGVEQNSMTTTSVLLGDFRESYSLKQEFFDLVKLNEKQQMI